jgi:hypothetical protein
MQVEKELAFAKANNSKKLKSITNSNPLFSWVS